METAAEIYIDALSDIPSSEFRERFRQSDEYIHLTYEEKMDKESVNRAYSAWERNRQEWDWDKMQSA